MSGLPKWADLFGVAPGIQAAPCCHAADERDELKAQVEALRKQIYYCSGSCRLPSPEPDDDPNAYLFENDTPVRIGPYQPATMLVRHGCICGGEDGPCECDGGAS